MITVCLQVKRLVFFSSYKVTKDAAGFTTNKIALDKKTI